MPKFSIVIPLYNKVNCIEKTVKSALNQSYSDYEIIIVNDGSKDGSLQKVQQFNNDCVRIYSQDNAGVSAARNLGIEKSFGEFIAFLDADDEWEPNYLETINFLVEEYKDSDLFVTKYYVHYKNRIVKSSSPQIDNTNHSCVDSYWITLSDKYDFVWTSCTTVRKTAINNVGGFVVGELTGQDLGLWARIAQNNPKVAFSTDFCSNYYREAENNARTRVRVPQYNTFMKILKYEQTNSERNSQELRSICSKYNKKMIMLIFLTNLSGKRQDARLLLGAWNPEHMKCVKYLLYIATFLPKTINCFVYKIRLKVF